MAGTCGYRWNAPRAIPGGRKYVEQVCSKDKGHKDDHKSVGKVTAPNKEK